MYNIEETLQMLNRQSRKQNTFTVDSKDAIPEGLPIKFSKFKGSFSFLS